MRGLRPLPVSAGIGDKCGIPSMQMVFTINYSMSELRRLRKVYITSHIDHFHIADFRGEASVGYQHGF